MNLTKIPQDGHDKYFYMRKPTKRYSDSIYMLDQHRYKRDAIIDLVRIHHKDDAFYKPFVSHLMKIGKKSLDEYGEVEFLIKEYGQRLLFTSSRTEQNVLSYIISELTLEPDVRLAERRLWFF